MILRVIFIFFFENLFFLFSQTKWSNYWEKKLSFLETRVFPLQRFSLISQHPKIRVFLSFAVFSRKILNWFYFLALSKKNWREMPRNATGKQSYIISIKLTFFFTLIIVTSIVLRYSSSVIHLQSPSIQNYRLIPCCRT